MFIENEILQEIVFIHVTKSVKLLTLKRLSPTGFNRYLQGDVANTNPTMLCIIYNVSLKQGISEPEFYGHLVYRFRKNVVKSNFSEQFRNFINPNRIIGYNLDIMRQTPCLVVNPITIDSYRFLFNCTTAVRASDSVTASS